MKLDKNFFLKQAFDDNEKRKIKQSALRDLNIARTSQENEVMFHFAYMALIKIGIYCLAREGYRVKSRPGHHQKIIESLSGILGIEEIVIIGDKMRKDRNLDFYSADISVSAQDATEYLKFVENILLKI